MTTPARTARLPRRRATPWGCCPAEDPWPSRHSPATAWWEPLSDLLLSWKKMGHREYEVQRSDLELQVEMIEKSGKKNCGSTPRVFKECTTVSGRVAECI
jgi:hypothetical protein